MGGFFGIGGGGGGSPAPVATPAPAPAPEPKQTTEGTDRRRRAGQQRNRTLLTGGLGGQAAATDTEKKGLLGQ